MQRVIRTFLTLVLVGAMSTMALAADPATPAPSTDIKDKLPPLTEASIERFVKAFPTMAKELEAHGNLMGKMMDKAAAWQSMEAYKTATADLNAIAAKHGYTTFEAFAMDMAKIMMVWSKVTMDNAMSDADKQMQAQIATIEADPNIPPAQKAMVIEQMKLASGQMKAMSGSNSAADGGVPITDAERALIKKYQDTMTKMFETMNK